MSASNPEYPRLPRFKNCGDEINSTSSNEELGYAASTRCNTKQLAIKEAISSREARIVDCRVTSSSCAKKSVWPRLSQRRHTRVHKPCCTPRGPLKSAHRGPHA